MARWRRWLYRYGPAELSGLVTARWALTGNEVAAAFGGAIGETIGFSSVIIAREIRSDAAPAAGSGPPRIS